MDHDIRTLERLALQGDANAALAFVAAYQRTKTDKPAHLHNTVLPPSQIWGFQTRIFQTGCNGVLFEASLTNTDSEEIGIEVITTRDTILVGRIPQEVDADYSEIAFKKYIHMPNMPSSYV